MFLSASYVYAQKDNDVEDEIELTLSSDGNILTIKVLVEHINSFELFLYKSYEEVKISGIETGSNPYAIDVSDWTKGIYHLKIDYDYVTQFRHIEIFD